jgi:hypothetical protein
VLEDLAMHRVVYYFLYEDAFATTLNPKDKEKLMVFG